MKVELFKTYSGNVDWFPQYRFLCVKLSSFIDLLKDFLFPLPFFVSVSKSGYGKGGGTDVGGFMDERTHIGWGGGG